MKCVVCRETIKYEENSEQNQKWLKCNCTKTKFPNGWVIEESDKIKAKK